MHKISFFLNGRKYEVDPEKVSPDARLVDFIRDEAHLTGTKTTCRQGGCGACVVSVKMKNPVTHQESVNAVNSCLCPLLCCNGWNISTVEALGSKKNGLHPIQQRLVHFSGTQCGFCTSGMVMSMHSLMESKNHKVTSKEVEKILDGNICRCTGYRPILDAFKSLATDASEEVRSRCVDIEDVPEFPCTFNCLGCEKVCEHSNKVEPELLELKSGEKWATPFSVAKTLEILQTFQKTQMKYRLIAGNTGMGVYKGDGPYEAFVSLGQITELKNWTVDSTGITVGAGVTISETIAILNSTSAQEVVKFSTKVASHMERIANLPVRNVATLAGNLMLKHAHNEFPSDIFILLETLGTKVRIDSTDEAPKWYTVLEFLSLDMHGKLILSFFIPQRKNGYFFSSFKISQRFQNSHAYVNAGFLIKIDASADEISTTEKPRILFGGINNGFTHASATEAYLGSGKPINPETLKAALSTLKKEIHPEPRQLDGTVEYRKLLPQSVLYKVFLELLNETGKLSGKFSTGCGNIERNLSSGCPRFTTGQKKNELYGPTSKLEAPAQTTGEAEYLNDMPKLSNELVGAFAITSVGKARLKFIDTSDALRVPGVVDFVTAKDIPGKNNGLPVGFFPGSMPEPIFVESEISYAGQALGVILAESRESALAGLRKLKVEYEVVEKPLIGIENALIEAEKNGLMDKVILASFSSQPQDTDGDDVNCTHSIKGQLKTGGQAHFHMETQGCICLPVEDGMTIYCGTQWMDQAVRTVAGALGVPNNSINMIVRRIGGSFGARITKSSSVVAAGAVAANKVNRPVRLILDLETNLSMIGKRPPYIMRYKVGFDDAGRIGKLEAEVISETGYTANEPEGLIGIPYFQNMYRAQNWELKVGALVTNTATNTYMRGPGSAQVVALIEYIMEHIGYTLGKDPFEVRMVNAAKSTDLAFPSDKPFSEEILAIRLLEEIKNTAEYDQRKRNVEAFNSINRWKKRGIALIPVRFFVDYYGCKYPTYVTINHHDGSVSVAHSGIEIGQGINTKVAQTVAFALKIPLEKIQVKPTDNLIGSNGSFTAGSITSEACCEGVLRACRILNERMDRVKNKMENKSPTWEEVVEATYKAHESLSAIHMHGPKDGIQKYNVWIASSTEVEVDVLTGEFKVARVELLEDTGKSLSPSVDIGQIEGAYVMGLGLWTTEQLIYDEDTGKLLTDNTWTYKVPESKDIPEYFRVTIFNSPTGNPKGVLGSKATGEPALLSSVGVVFALKNAIDSARRDAGNFDWYEIETPITPQDIVKYALTTTDQFTL